MKITIDKDANITFTNKGFQSAFDADGSVSHRRASHVVPTGLAKRAIFKLLRRLVCDASPIAQWTRGWKGNWTVDLSPSHGPLLGPFNDRHVAIAHEITWLENNVI